MLLPEEVGISDFAISHFTNLKKEIHEISFPNLTPSIILISLTIRKDYMVPNHMPKIEN